MKKGFLVMIILFSCGKENKQQTNVKNPSLITYSINKVLSNNARIGIQNYLKKSKIDIIFLGDNQTEGFTELFNNIKNHEIAGNTTSDIVNRLVNITEEQPKEIFLQIGLNDISQNVEVNKVY